MARYLKPIYTASTAKAAWVAFEELKEKWGKTYQRSACVRTRRE